MIYRINYNNFSYHKIRLYDESKRNVYFSTSDKQFCFYQLRFCITNHISNSVIKYSKNFARFIWITFSNIFLNIIHIIQVFNKSFRILKIFTPSRFLISNWYFAYYKYFVYRNIILSICGWWFIRLNNEFVFLDLEPIINIVYWC